jgi:cysteinyl-tRNA synthetase
MNCLGESFDIHGGGIDLQFPHHENEIAQSCCAHPQGGFATVWMHNEMLLVEGKKMSKALGNFFTVRDLLDQGVPGEVIRYVFLMTHYRKPMDWTADKADQAKATLRKWYALASEAAAGAAPSQAAIDALCDDLNSHAVLAECHQLALAGDAIALRGTMEMVGLMGKTVPDWASAPVVDLSVPAARLAAARDAAMQTKDFSEVDRLKSALIAAGVEVRMSKSGVDLVPGAGFDPTKLEGL